MLAKEFQLTNTDTYLDDLDAFLANPLNYKFTIHKSNELGNIVKELHRDSEGYIASCYKEDERLKQKFYKIDEFDCETENAFFSVNTFYTKWRNVKCVSEYTCLFSDIDFYNTGLTAQQILWLLEEDVFGKIIPYPTWLVSSGNGFYYILKFSKNIKVRTEDKINFDLKRKWETCMKFIYDTLKDYGADKGAMDSARVLRIDGTYNTKNNKHKKVEIIENYGNTIYDLDEFIELWLPDKYIQKDKPKTLLKAEYTVEKIQVAKDNGKRYGKSLKKLNLERMRDIMRLINMRNGDCTGTRNYMLLLYTYHTLQSNEGNLEQALQDTVRLNNSFKEPEKISQVNAIVRTAHKAYLEWLSGGKVLVNGKWCRKGYNYTNANLIEILCITEEEQRKLKTIKSKKLVQEQKNKKEKRKEKKKTKMD
ncbi:MAG: Replication protein [Sporanaerobacter sp.]|uniref:hypothetical protein n=1 Tax=Sporanaerobacter sp. TaxID=2010183 RepID=UPI003A101459